MKTIQLDITPDIANQLLIQNTGNRTVRTTVVARYSDDMKNGNWGLSHQGIAIDINGNLIDGQHRLLAIVKSGETIPMLVTTGLQPEIFEVIDKLCARSDADSLRMRQKETEVFRLISMVYKGNYKPTLTELKGCIAVFSTIYDSLCFTATNVKTFSSAPVRTAAILAAVEKPENIKTISKAYEDMVNGNIEHLSVSQRSMLRSVYNGTAKNLRGNSERIDLLQRFFTAFCMDNTELTKIFPTSLDRIRQIIVTKMESTK